MRLFNLCSAVVAVLLTLAACGLWTRSYSQADSIEISNRGPLRERRGAWRYLLWMESAQGKVRVHHVYYTVIGQDAELSLLSNICAVPVRDWRVRPPEESKVARENPTGLGFSYVNDGGMSIINFPHWSLASVFGLGVLTFTCMCYRGHRASW